MSEQGELKDRIWSAMPKILLFAVAQNTSSDTMNKELKVIDTIIDEAAKEFPRLIAFPSLGDPMDACIHDPSRQEYESWYKKWFGEKI